MARYIFMNGVQFNPTSFEVDDTKIGESRRMGDSTLRYYHRAFKAKWSLNWTNVQEAYLPAIKTIAHLTSSFTLIDYDGISHTVMILPGGAKYKLDATGVDSASVKRYTIDLVLDEV